jgi:MoaA/NifB/PqqE/SkfB family radical SAM enzyme
MNWNGNAPNRISEKWHTAVILGVVKAAELSLHVSTQGNFFVERLLQALDRAIDENGHDPEIRAHILGFGAHLKAFLLRVASERPAAARAILRFLGTYVQDVYRRTRSQDTGIAAPGTVVIEPTDRCNLRCPGCYAKSSSDGSDLPFDRMVEIVQQVIYMGVSLITISGGEPFLRERADRTISRLAGRFPNHGFLVYTNGTMIDEAVAVRLGKLGNIFPAISVEGFEHQTDARRGQGTATTNRLVRELLARHGVMTGFSAAVTRDNAEAIASDDFIHQRIAEGDMFGWFFLMQPIGRAPRPDLMVTARQRALLREAILRWRQADLPIFLGDFWNDGPLVGGCIAGGRSYLHIYANGDISPCVFAPVASGNIFDIIAGRSEYSSLNDFVQRNPVFVAYREEQAKIKDRKRPCLLIDHPEAFRRIAEVNGCRPAKNMPLGYLDGDIARAIDLAAAEWRHVAPTLPVAVAPEHPPGTENIHRGCSDVAGDVQDIVIPWSGGISLSLGPSAGTRHECRVCGAILRFIENVGTHRVTRGSIHREEVVQRRTS